MALTTLGFHLLTKWLFMGKAGTPLLSDGRLLRDWRGLPYFVVYFIVALGIVKCAYGRGRSCGLGSGVLWRRTAGDFGVP